MDVTEVKRLKKIIITVGAVTYAVKARRLLKAAGVESRLVKVSPERTHSGCTHGIEINELDLFAVAGILRKGGISYALYNEQK